MKKLLALAVMVATVGCGGKIVNVFPEEPCPCGMRVHTVQPTGEVIWKCVACQPPSSPTPTPTTQPTPMPSPSASPSTLPTPGPTGAVMFPQGLPDSAYVKQGGETGEPTAGLVRGAIATVLQRRGIHCEGDACDKVPTTCAEFGKEIGTELRSRGISAGLYNESWINCDQVYVCRPPETDPWLCMWDAWEFGEGAWDGKVGCGVRWPFAGGASYAGTYRLSLGSTHTPPPPPVVGEDYGCPEPRPERAFTAATLPQGWGPEEIGRPRWVIDSGPHGDWIDTTIQTRRNLPFCQATGQGDGPPTPYPPRDSCPTRLPGHPDERACDQYISEGGRVTIAKGGATCEMNPSNQAQFRRTSAAGTCQLCSPPSYTKNPYDDDPLTMFRACSAAW